MLDSKEWKEVESRVRAELEEFALVQDIPCSFRVLDEIMRDVRIAVEKHYDPDVWSLYEFCRETAEAYLDEHFFRLAAEPPPKESRRGLLIEDILWGPVPDEKKERDSEASVDWDERLRVFSRIKADHPNWPMFEVALEASKPVAEGGLGEHANEHTVRNTYRKFGLPWPRGDRRRKSPTE